MTLRMTRTIVLLAVLPVLTLPCFAGCPPPDEIAKILAGIDFSGAARAVRFSTEFPQTLREQAAAKPGKPAALRVGQTGYGAMIIEIPVERVWMALNDEDHHAGELPVRHSEVIEGRPRGPSRVLFQYFKKWGMGRWWVSRVTMNRELFESSGGVLWELWWRDVLDLVDPTRPPINEVSGDLKPILSSYGSWVLIPLGDSCTQVEYFNTTDPGGAIGATQRLMIARTIRSTMQGISRLAQEHVTLPHDDAMFQRPDGTPLP
jgi:hypothetical protein